MISDRILGIESLQRSPGLLLSWFSENQRQLEWRMNPLPYYVWVSEIMLQQTRVEAVKPYFSRFIEALPDIKSLSECPEDKLLKLWEGLGYYSRVRNMKKAAAIICGQMNGELPGDPKILESLPGIGPYTAGAIASIAYHYPVPAVDGNVLRVLSRICGSTECIDDPAVKKDYEEKIRRLLESRSDVDPALFNQAMMELGALVCLPNGSPECGRCPLREICRAHYEGTADSIPVRKTKKPRRIEERTVLVVRDSQYTVIRRRPSKGLLAGLYELPNFEGHLSVSEALSEAGKIGLFALRILPLPDERHVFSHVEWHMQGYLVLTEEIDPGLIKDPYFAVEPLRTQEEYPVPAAFARYAAYLDIYVGKNKINDI